LRRISVKKINVERWNLRICDSIMDSVHNNYYSIQEFYIPKHEISFNYVNKEVHIFKSEKTRYSTAEKIEEFTMPENLVKMLEDYLKIREDAEKQMKDFMSDKTKIS
jgi:hypothetical protein